MSRPTTIRTAIWLLYFKLLFPAGFLVLYVSVLLSPTQQQRAKFNPAEHTAVQLMSPILSMLVPIAAILLTLWFIRRRKKLFAMITSLLVFWFTAPIRPDLEMLVGVVIVIMLILRPSRAYFTSADLLPAKQDEGLIPIRADADSADLEMPAEPLPSPAGRNPKTDPIVEIRGAGPEDAETVHSLMIAAFEEYRAAVPPSSALEETVESVRESLEGGQGAGILFEDGKPAAMVRYKIEGETISFFRLSVLPSRRRRGYGKQLVKWVEKFGIGNGLNLIRCKVRQTVQNNVAMYQDMGYEITDQELVVRPTGSVKALTMEKKLGV